jgi:hypothetical protein
LLEHLNSQIELVTGKIQKIYTLDGIRIHNIDEMKASEHVLVANDDPFIKIRYNVMAIRSSTGQPGLNGATLHNEFISKIRPITTKRRTRKSTVQQESDYNSSSEAPPQRLTTSHSVRKSKTKQVIEQERQEVPSDSEREVLKPVRVIPKKAAEKKQAEEPLEYSKPVEKQEKVKMPEPEQEKRIAKAPAQEGTKTPKPKTPKTQQVDVPEKGMVLTNQMQ